MNKGLIFLTCVSIILVPILNVYAAISVGVKDENWMQYDLSYTGSPPELREIGMKIEVVDVQRDQIAIKETIEYSDGTQEIITNTIDLEVGTLGDGVIIPAHWGEGDEFFDENEVWIRVEGTEPDLQFLSHDRTVAYVWSDECEDYWETETAIRFYVTVTYDTYVMIVEIANTNILGSDQTLIRVSVYVAVLIIAVIGFFRYRRKLEK